MTTDTITLAAGLLFIFLAIIGGGITGKETHIPVIRTTGRIALGFIGLLLCLPFVVGRIQWAGSFPRGTIIAWNHKSGPVPAGWALCDGNNGTPDMQGRFLRGTTKFEQVGQVGGSETHTHIVVKNGHRIGDGFREDGTCQRGAADEKSHVPPFTTVVYPMKL